MTREQLQEYFRYAAQSYKIYNAGQALSLPSDGLFEHVDRCIDLGLADFWSARAWSFRTKAIELTTVAGTEDHVLPDDFERVLYAREKTTQEGQRLIFYPMGEFMRLVPSATAHSQSAPVMFTAYFDGDVQKHKAKFYPVPASGTIIYMEILIKNQNDPDVVPDPLVGGLQASIAKFIPVIGSPGHQRAIIACDSEIQRLWKVDQVNAASTTKMLDDTDTRIETRKLWYDDD